ncbi:hypothetical protein QSJ19_21515 [Gordonia sp. ABSL11-1]|uniref:hypothetical protein n=1 Tax=Gordonia sp. ABSL11-1 TaxID=3053924 RepID=UPI00257407C8|nr:hypothetical protein [Gordonia sp. ABSL11-1]MDL9948107.1 hypothetical protein [Gordonia sp. ABSL11-1]
MIIPSDYVMLARINLGINAILSELGATFDTRDQLDCVDGGEEPRTALEPRPHCAPTLRGYALAACPSA